MKRNFVLGLLLLAACLYFTAGTAQAIDLFDGQLVIHGVLSEQMCMRAHETQPDMAEKYDFSIFNLRSTAKLEAMWHIYKGPEYEINFYTELKEFYDAADHVDANYRRELEWASGGTDHGREELRNYNTFTDISREMYAEVINPLYDVRIGKQIVSWGETSFERMADTVNPVDARGDLNPAYPDFAQIKRGLWMGRFFFTPPDQPMDMSYEVLVIPDFEPTRYWPAGYQTMNPASTAILKNPNEMYLPYYRDAPTGIKMDNLQAGIRVRGILYGWDWALSFLHQRNSNYTMKTGKAIASALPSLLGTNFINGWPGRAKDCYKYAWEDNTAFTVNRPVDVTIPIIPGTPLTMSGNIFRFEGVWTHNRDNARLTPAGTNVKDVQQDRFAGCWRWDTKIYIPFLTPWNRNTFLSSGTQLFMEYMPDKKKTDEIYPWVWYEQAKGHQRWSSVTEELSYDFWNNRILLGLYYDYDINQHGGYVAPALGFKPTFNWTFMARYIDFYGLNYKNTATDLDHKDFWTFEITYEF